MADVPAPVTRSRAGNTMGRTRAAVLDGALRAIERYGARRTTMGDIARMADVAKATLYNHFRSKDEVYGAAAEAAVTALAERAAAVAAQDGLVAALGLAAREIAGHPVLARLRAEEPAVVGQLLAASTGEPVRTAVASVLDAGGAKPDEASVELVGRWLAGHLAGPAVGDGAVDAAAERVAAAVLVQSDAAEITMPADDVPVG